jgi:hypothetical protein
LACWFLSGMLLALLSLYRSMELLGHMGSPCFTFWGTAQLGFFICLFVGRTGVWTQGFTLAWQTLSHWSHAPSPFLLQLFQIGSRTFSLGWPQIEIVLFSTSPVAGITGVLYQAQLPNCFSEELFFFYSSYLSECVVISYCSFHFPNGLLHVFSGKMLVLILC